MIIRQEFSFLLVRFLCKLADTVIFALQNARMHHKEIFLCLKLIM